MSSNETSRDEVETIQEALRGVLDPELGISVVDMGLIRNIEPTDDEVEITVILTNPFCPMADLIKADVKNTASAAAGKPVTVTIGQERWDPSMLASEED
jgi:metal-sulfur cluster biosynthetic enzyme